MFEEGFKRYDGVKILKVFKADKKDASVTYITSEEKMPRFALIRAVCLESYTTVDDDCSVKEYKQSDFKDSEEYEDNILKQFAYALKNNLPVNIIIAVLKKGTNVEFVAKAEFV